MNCSAVGGSLLVLEKLLNDSKSGPLPCVMMDMNMLVGTEGRERAATEYQHLLKSNGFSDVTIAHLPGTTNRDVILAYKA